MLTYCFQTGEVVAFCDKFRFLSHREPEHEIFGEPLRVPFHLLVEAFRRYVVDLRKVRVDHDAMSADHKDSFFDMIRSGATVTPIISANSSWELLNCFRCNLVATTVLELFDRQFCLLDDVGEGGPLYRTMGRDNDFKCLVRRRFLKPNMASPLPDNNPSRPAECPNYLMVIQAGNLRHTAISITSASGAKSISSSTGSM